LGAPPKEQDVIFVSRLNFNKGQRMIKVSAPKRAPYRTTAITHGSNSAKSLTWEKFQCLAEIYKFLNKRALKMRNAVLAFVGLVSCFHATAASGQVVSEPVAFDEAEALAMDAKNYANEFGVSYDEALERMTIMLYGGPAVSELTSAEGTDFAGRFFDNSSSEFGLTVSTRKSNRTSKNITFTPQTKMNFGRMNAAEKKSRNEQRRAARLTARISDLEVTKAEDRLSRSTSMRVRYNGSQKYSITDLIAAHLILVGAGNELPGLNAVSIDEAGNTLRAFLTREPTPADNAAVAKLVTVPVALEFLPGGFVETSNMRGGTKLFATSSATLTSPRSCMTAFGARSNTLKNSAGQPITGMVTAAHCPSSTNIIADDGVNRALVTPSGHVSDTRGGTNTTDIRFVYATNQDPIGLGTFYFDASDAVRSVSSLQTIAGTTASNGSQTSPGTTTGSYLCHRGQTSVGSANSMQSCGEVISVRASQTLPTPSTLTVGATGGFFVMLRNTSSGKGTVLGATGSGSLRCYQGDSGGPWFAGTIAYGIMSSCAWEGGVKNSDRVHLALYTSVEFVGSAGAAIIVP
jgi:hypothetical protein